MRIYMRVEFVHVSFWKVLLDAGMYVCMYVCMQGVYVYIHTYIRNTCIHDARLRCLRLPKLGSGHWQSYK